MTTMTTLTDTLDELGFAYFTLADVQGVALNVGGQVGTYQALFIVRNHRVRVSASCPINVPLGARIAVAELVVRINTLLPLAYFVLAGDGKLRFHSQRVVTNADDVQNVLSQIVDTLDRFVPAVLSVIYGNETPEDALRCVA